MGVALVNIDHVYQLMKQNSWKLWVVKDELGYTRIDEQQDANCTVPNSIQQLKNCIDACSEAGIVLIELSSKLEKTEGRGGAVKGTKFSYRVRTKEQAETGSNPVQAVAGHSQDRIDQMNSTINSLQLKIQELQFEKKMDDLKRDLEDRDPFEKYLPLIQGFLSNAQAGRQAPPIAGVKGENDPEIKVSKKPASVLAGFLQRWKNLDADYVTMIEAIIVMGESDPDAYKVYAGQLKNALNQSKGGE